MEEDIEILENIIKEYNKQVSSYKCYLVPVVLDEDDISSIKNLINANKTLENIIKNNTIPLSLIKEELKKKDKIIDEMTTFIAGLDIDEEICKNINHCTADDLYTNCQACIKEYFTKKCEEVKNND